MGPNSGSFALSFHVPTAGTYNLKMWVRTGERFVSTDGTAYGGVDPVRFDHVGADHVCHPNGSPNMGSYNMDSLYVCTDPTDTTLCDGDETYVCPSGSSSGCRDGARPRHYGGQAMGDAGGFPPHVPVFGSYTFTQGTHTLYIRPREACAQFSTLCLIPQ